MSSSLQSLDAQLAALLAEWSIWSTLLAVLVAAVLVYPLLTTSEPDTHPLLLARQSSASAVRNKGESATYRSPEVPHGYPLRSGLNVKDAAAPRWAAGKDGDLRDIWREVQRAGTQGPDGKDVPAGLIMTVLGKEDLTEHSISELSKEIGIIGRNLKAAGVEKVAIFLPNSVEYLSAVFACAFYGLSPLLLPFDLPPAKVYECLHATGADGLICQAGILPLDVLAKSSNNLKHLTWVVEKTSQHMDWNGVPDEAQGRLTVGVWHDIVDENKANASAELPANEAGEKLGDIITVWQSSDMQVKPEIAIFSHGSIVAAVGALISAIPARQRLSSADLVLPADQFGNNYVFCQTLAALFAHASLAITSVAGPGVDLSLARRGVAPTVIIAGASTLVKLHQQETGSITSAFQKFGKYSHDQSMSAGRMPTDGILFKLLAPSSTSTNPGQLRLILTSERLGAASPPLSSTLLSDLRIFTRSRIIYALTTAKVAGAVAQTNVFDYRREDGNAASHFGVPLSSVEIKLVNSIDAEVGAPEPKGEIVVTGPAVAGGQVTLPVQGRLREDCTLAYA